MQGVGLRIPLPPPGKSVAPVAPVTSWLRQVGMAGDGCDGCDGWWLNRLPFWPSIAQFSLTQLKGITGEVRCNSSAASGQSPAPQKGYATPTHRHY